MYQLSKELVKMGDEVVILDRLYGPDDRRVEVHSGIRIIRTKATRFPLTWFERKSATFFDPFYNIRELILNRYFLIKRWLPIILEVRPDIINVYELMVAFLLMKMLPEYRSRIVFTHCSGDWPPFRGCMGFVERVLARAVLRHVGLAVAQNPDSARQLSAFTPAPRIVIIPPGVDTLFFNPGRADCAILSKYSLMGKRVITYVGRVTVAKGILVLLAAAEIICRAFDDVVFLIVGPFERIDVSGLAGNARRILNSVKTKGLAHSVLMLGFIPANDVAALMASSYLAVMPSLIPEAFGRVISEVMASGRPVIASRSQGAMAQIRDGWNGLLVSAGDAAALARAIQFALENPQVVEEMGVNALQSSRRLSWRSIAGKYTEQYRLIQDG